MSAEDLLKDVLASAELAEVDPRRVVVRSFQLGLLAAVEECECLAASSPSLKDDVLKLAVRLRHKAKEARL